MTTMDDRERFIHYATAWETLYRDFQERYEELNQKTGRNEYEDGAMMAYFEIVDAMETQVEAIRDILDDE